MHVDVWHAYHINHRYHVIVHSTLREGGWGTKDELLWPAAAAAAAMLQREGTLEMSYVSYDIFWLQ